ncbi:ImmA/IrrE family metallo-endopeptidase [Sphingobium yanoikuyae]|uniref:ImmA/IrrE family metallo-endopeptidase n=1 Tax=Sphingobium yanoikuyae TaxID=13690 RepID=UPI00345E218E
MIGLSAYAIAARNLTGTKMPYSPAVESRLSKPQVHKFAESVANQLNFSAGDDIHELVERMGGRVQIEDTLLTDPEHTGSLYVDSPSKFRIIVPSHTSPERDRFTVAHELGHYVLHYLWAKQKDPTLPDSVVAYRKGSDRIEWEANWFAAAFLMPETAFRAAFIEKSGEIRSIADAFRVSAAAAEVRAKDLGLIN